MEIKADPQRGHIALVRDSETVVTFTDLGPVLQVWQYGSGVELDPASAERLADALHAWARRKMWCRAYARAAAADGGGA